MSPKSLPNDFAALLSPAGQRVLHGRSPLCGVLANPRTRFVSQSGLIDKVQAHNLRSILERALTGRLQRINQPIPPEATWEMTRNYGEALPKTALVWTAYLESRREAAWQAAEDIGLLALLRSDSFRAFAQQLAGRALKKKWGQQVLCYGPGDYSGPHNDHHPEEVEARAGYLDLHLSLASPAVQSHFLVYARAGHLAEMVDVARDGLISAYRLPFWHYTTPLQAKPNRHAEAQRWVLLGTFIYAGEARALPPPRRTAPR
jgi:hypothetical protein